MFATRMSSTLASHLRRLTSPFLSTFSSSLLSPTPSNKTLSPFSTSSVRYNSNGGVVVSFKKVSFGYLDDEDKYLMKEVDFSIRQGSKVTIMGQNGSGKSSIIKLLGGNLQPNEGNINVEVGAIVATAQQTMAQSFRELTILEYFTTALNGNTTGIDSRIAKVLATVQLEAKHDRLIKSFSGGQQARLLLAAALVIEPDIILLDEPTNNLDHNGIDHLRGLIQETGKTCIVISHDEEFLNSFTDNVLYLDVFSKKVEQYDGDYHTVKTGIAKRIARENAENARMGKVAQAKKDQANKFANKGGGMRAVAKKMREVAATMEDSMVDVRREDVSLRKFSFPYQTNGQLNAQSKGSACLMEIEAVNAPFAIAERTGMALCKLKMGVVALNKNYRIQICGPNGCGKTTLLEAIVNGQAEGVYVNPNAVIGYYRQDFSNLDFTSTALACLEKASAGQHNTQEIRTMAASFMLRGEIIKQRVSTLSEGQKGLLSLTCLMLQRPSILIMDEPTNHINFRHLPALANAIKTFEGGVIVVSHDSDFVSKLKVDHVIDLGYEFTPDSASRAA